MSSSSTEIDCGFFERRFPTFARFFGNFGWPIFVRQLRADFRKNRFFLFQFLCLCILGVTLIAMISSQANDDRKTATQIGQSLFNSFFVIQYLVILLVFPACSSTAFTEERVGLTIDLLLTSTLRPSEIVWGKFLAATVYCLLYVIASIPLLSISFLFGGVELSEVLIAYAILVGLTLVISMLGVCMSSCCSGSMLSTLAMYAIVLVITLLSAYVYSALEEASGSGSSATVIGELLRWKGPGLSLGGGQLLLLPALCFPYLFLITANRIRPPSDDKSLPLRLLTFFAIPAFIAVGFSQHFFATSSGGVTVSRMGWIRDVVLQVFLLLSVCALIFPTEDANISRRNRSHFGRWTGLRYPLRVFSPGPFWGFTYTVLLSILTSAGVFFAWEASCGVAAEGPLDHFVEQTLMTLPLCVGAVGALGFFLAACDFKPLYSRLTTVFICLITLLLPLIFLLSSAEQDKVWTSWEVLWRGSYLSPITLWISLSESLMDEEKKQFILFGLPVIEVARIVYAAVIVALCTGGVCLSRRAGYPVLGMNTSREQRKGP